MWRGCERRRKRYSRLVKTLVPRRVVVVEAFSYASLSDPALQQDELAIVAGASTQRRREFATGRICAHRAVRMLGAEEAPILRRTDGAARWPAGVLGSITHCAGYCSAAVAWTREIHAIGIDAEPHAAIDDDAFAAVSTAAERAAVRALRASIADLHWDCVTFSAKESAFKAWSSHAPLPFTMDEVSVAVDPSGWFRACQPGGGGATVDGRWIIEGGLVRTAVVVARVRQRRAAADSDVFALS